MLPLSSQAEQQQRRRWRIRHPKEEIFNEHKQILIVPINRWHEDVRRHQNRGPRWDIPKSNDERQDSIRRQRRQRLLRASVYFSMIIFTHHYLIKSSLAYVNSVNFDKNGLEIN